MDEITIQVARFWAVARQDGDKLIVPLRTSKVTFIKHDKTIVIEKNDEKVEIELY